MDCPSKTTHPFWSSYIGSFLTLRINEPPDSQIKGIDITVYSVSPSYYKLCVLLSNENYTLDYLTKKQSIEFLKKEWMNLYKDKTVIDYKIFMPTDMSKLPLKETQKSISLALQSLSLSNSRNNSRDNSRDNSRNNSRDSSPRSPDHITPRTPRTPNSRSSNSSPRSHSNSPRSSDSPREWFQKRLSLQLRRSKNIEFDLSSSSTESSPRVTFSDDISNESPSPKRNDDLRRSIHRANSPSPRSKDNSPRSPKCSDSRKKLFEDILKRKK